MQRRYMVQSKASSNIDYLDPGQLIRQNVDPEDRISLEKLIGRGGWGESPSPPSF